MVDPEEPSRDHHDGEDRSSSKLLELDQLERIDHEEHGQELKLLFAAYSLGRWGAGMWDFLAALLLMRVGNDSLLLTAAYGLVQAAATAAFGAAVGNSVDKTSHIKLLRLGIGARNVSIAVSAIALSLLLADRSLPRWGRNVVIVLVDSLAAVGILSGLALEILLQRDWAVTLGDLPGQSLSRINSVMKRIDLVCKLLAPAFVGIWMSISSPIPCLIATVVWNVLSLALEYRLLHTVYNRVPALQNLSRSNSDKQYEMEVPASSIQAVLVRLAMIDGWVGYFREEVVLAAVALAILYCTVLSFGPVMTAALDWKGVPALAIGAARGFGALAGVAATYLYPLLQSNGGTAKAGLLAIYIQWLCLMTSVASIWIHGRVLSTSLLISGIVASRLGLWMFDLAVTQLMQARFL